MHARILFLDFSSTFNTIFPQHLVSKLVHLDFNAAEFSNQQSPICAGGE